MMIGASTAIEKAVKAWNGVTAHPHRFGGIEFRLGKRELGHIHGDSLVDIPFPMKIRSQLIAEGVVQKHHVLPESGWISFFVRTEGDIEKAIELLRISYDAAMRQKRD